MNKNKSFFDELDQDWGDMLSDIYEKSQTVTAKVIEYDDKIVVPSIYMDSDIEGTLIIPNGVTHINSNTFKGCTGIAGELIIPDSVISIDYSAFEGCTGITKLVLSKNLRYIGESAFEGCTGLSGTLVIPEYVKTIQDRAFLFTNYTKYCAPKGIEEGFDIIGQKEIPSWRTNSWANYDDEDDDIEYIYY